MDTTADSFATDAPVVTASPLAAAAVAAAATSAPARAAAPPPRAAQPTLLEQLVRAPGAFLDRIADPSAAEAARLVRALVLTVALGAALFGVVVGSFRGGLQVLYCAAKLPLVLVGTLAVCAPAFVAIARAFGTRVSAREVVTLALGASARFALVLAGLAPVVWLAQGVTGYHGVILVIVGACAVAGLAAAALLFRGLSRARVGAGALAGAAFVTLYALVGGHTAWMLRPFVVRPQTRAVPFVRAVEGDLLHSVRTSARSAAGVYEMPRTRQALESLSAPQRAAPAEAPQPDRVSGDTPEARRCAEGAASCD